MAEEDVPRVLFNLEQVGSFGTQADDVMVLGDCDAGVRKLADELGWRDELEKTWRELVGEEEAERQLQGAKKRVAGLHDEVAKLADEVEEVLHIDDREDRQGEDHKKVEEKDQGTPESDSPGDAEGKKEEQPGKPAGGSLPEINNPSATGQAGSQSSGEQGVTAGDVEES
jgi:NAD-dependent histone deacetylase SIR2